MSYPIHWLYQQFIGAISIGQALCYLCGTSCPEKYIVAKGLADTFNSHYLARCPSSSYLCAACQWYFDSKAGHPDFRKMSLMVWKTGWKQWERATMKQDIADTVSGGTTEDVYLVVSLSKKKHILLQAPLNSQGTRLLAIQVEEQVAYIDQSTWQVINRSFMHLLGLGHNKGEILSGNLYSNTLRKHGQIKEAMNHSQMLAPYRNSPQLELLSYVTIMEDKDETNITGDGDDQGSSLAPEGSLDTDQSRLQEQVSHGHLDTIREQRGSNFSHEQHASQISEPTLWEV